MGYAKYTEDNLEILLGRTEEYIPIENKKKTEFFFCPYCNRNETSKESLFEHIKLFHNITHPVIVLNDRVVNDDKINVKSIQNLSVFIYGFSELIKINGKTVSYNSEESVTITDIACREIQKTGELSLEIGHRKVVIALYTIQEVRPEVVNPVIRNWEGYVENNKMINFCIPKECNEVEREYLNGFYNYFLACISSGDDKKNRYYDAYSILNTFSSINALGICALKVIAFKFNWLNKLRYLCSLAKDEFNIVYSFYRELEFESVPSIIVDYENTMFIENELREYIDAVTNFAFGNYKPVEKYIDEFDLLSSSDVNQNDRMFFLKGKIALKNNNHKEYRNSMRKIINVELSNDGGTL